MDFTEAELDMLVDAGYSPGYMMDIREGDLVAIPPVTRWRLGDQPDKVLTIVVSRLVVTPSDYRDEDGRMVQHRVVNFIGMDLDRRPHHLNYGSTYPCFYKREP